MHSEYNLWGIWSHVALVVHWFWLQGLLKVQSIFFSFDKSRFKKQYETEWGGDKLQGANIFVLVTAA